MKELTISLVGSAGEGLDSIGSLFSTVLAEHKYALFSWKEYESRVRGGFNSYHLKISSQPQNYPREQSDLLLALNPEAQDKYTSLLKPSGLLIGPKENSRFQSLVLSFKDLAKKELGNSLYANAIALGFLTGILKLKLELLLEALQKKFATKSLAIINNNLEGARLGYGQALDSSLNLTLPPSGEHNYFFTTGHPATALGAARAGCHFMAAYPMTPSTGLITYLSQKQEELKVFTLQAEDEIAAINLALGASFAGVRSMTATSGGGFALMVESISLAGMTETPVVIVLAQRPGPATGLPTRTAQGDLLFAIFAGHGEFPKVVFAPSDPEELYLKTIKAFNLAYKYQLPAIILTDQFLADSNFSYWDFNWEGETPQFFRANPSEFKEYKRYQFTPSGISPRLCPGQSVHLVGADSDEHDEWGHITEELDKVAKPMLEKRLNKLKELQKEIAPPLEVDIADSKYIFISFGSTKESVLAAQKHLRTKGEKVGVIHFSELWPLPSYSFPQNALLITVENNATAQLAKLLNLGYSLNLKHSILKYNGLPLTPEEIGRKFDEIQNQI
ncbi:MAG: 2-oxoglutarate/2-oxoacid ferredoxin oxidoreductase subunit alpha [Desulfonauticus sp.]|jgi:2-oxoglutarate ferredoxin oxidoreductase subunit alpha|nr:MAG: 2-oxoglutarate ferredoxin oxidoreductase alpha subunit [Desulfonauticus sp. 38_4375]MDK2921540.1 2-oxoglutarate/2-oxoacid ferredoxin oxidoreductase subunit alpha [Desulfonauticus sp.]